MSARLLPMPHEAANGKNAPNDIEGEWDLVANSLSRPETVDIVVGIVKAEHFYSSETRAVWQSVEALYAIGAPIDGSTVRMHVRDRGNKLLSEKLLEEVKFRASIGLVAHIERLATQIANLWRLRALADRCWSIAAKSYGDVGDVHDFVETAAADIAELAFADSAKSGHRAAESVQMVFQEIGQLASGAVEILSTGFKSVDEKVIGLFGSELTVIGARPGMGKTAFAWQIAEHVAGPESPDSAALFVSLEMKHTQLLFRAVCGRAHVDSKSVRRNETTSEGWESLTASAKWISQCEILVDDRSAQSPLDIRSQARRMKAELARSGKRLRVVVVDYLQLMRARMLIAPNGNREQEVAACSGALKALSKELDVPVIALSQLNRDGAKTNRRPSLSDMRESGAIEQDADSIWLLHREEYYLREKTPQHLRGVAELIIAKARNGEPGTVGLRFRPTFTSFEDLQQGEWDDINRQESRR